LAKKVIGWIERVSLPDLQISRIKAKADTGARTSALHAENIRVHLRENGHREVSFTFYPSSDTDKAVRVTCPLKESRMIKSSTGALTLRPVISTTLRIGTFEKRIEITLINRSIMEFRMLLGRTALRQFLVDPRHSYLLTGKGKPK
jgi:hypothetical protein